MQHIQASPDTLLEQSWKTADEYLLRAIRCIDERLGEGAAQQSPQLVAAFMQVAAQDFATAMRAAVEQDSSMNIAAISDSLDRIARAIAERD